MGWAHKGKERCCYILPLPWKRLKEKEQLLLGKPRVLLFDCYRPFCGGLATGAERPSFREEGERYTDNCSEHKNSTVYFAQTQIQESGGRTCRETLGERRLLHSTRTDSGHGTTCRDV